MNDTVIRRLGSWAVFLVAAIAAGVSFIHIVTLALSYGQPRVAALMLPVSIDGLVAASSLALLRAARMNVAPPVLARVGLFSGVGATLACNIGFGLLENHGHGVGRSVIGALLSGWPAFAFIVGAELAVAMAQKVARKKSTTPQKSVPPDTGADSLPPAKRTAKPRQPGTGKRGRPATPIPETAWVAFRASMETGAPMSARKLADEHLDGNRRAAAKVIAASQNGHRDA